MEQNNTSENESENILHQIAEELSKKNLSTHNLIKEIRQNIDKHFENMQHPYVEKNILESRFTSAEEAYKRGMKSCGSYANITTVILKDMGYKVKLIHGSTPKSRNHAWIKVKTTGEENWTEYDPTSYDCLPKKDAVKKFECSSWEEIRDVIENEHNSWVKSHQQ